ncbi:cytochrome c biogenesis CcdA family protein [Ferroacidibacillus organovorans]|uniref:cytochrome c biogenesis CcdA family protein n=1 Tax=Ferroacidibacillus organovorans TaxID=1765683 RepID=UPI00083073DD|nr:cytochrome c biogenesis protein CcdA [Ferroacidibacillus organovorans]
MIGKEERNQKAFPFSAAFTPGMAITSAGIGVVAALVGKELIRLFTGYHLDQWIPATIGILMGLQLLGILKLRMPMLGRMRSTKPKTTGQALMLGLPFGFVVTPCTIPIFIIVIGVVAASANIWAGAAILVTYAIGKGVILTIVALTSSTLVKSFIQKWASKIEKFAGTVLILASIYLIFFQVKMPIPLG